MHSEPDGGRKVLRDLLEYNFYVRLFGSGLLMLMLLGYVIYSFIIGNIGILAIFFGILFGVIFVVTVVYVSSRTINNTRLKINYLSSDCYKVTKKPFIKDYRMPYYQYQFKVFDKLNSQKLGDMLFDLTLKEQTYDNSDISIDILLFHKSGIYAIQTLALDGPLKGLEDERIWTPYFYLGVKKTLSIDHTLLKSWKKANILVNPIMQTNLYTKNLKRYLPSYEIKGVSILDDKMIDQYFSSMDNKLFSLKAFIKFIHDQPYMYSNNELDEAKKKILSSMV